MKLGWSGAALIALLFTSAPARAETSWITADRDATLIEDPDGALGNGSGPAFFAGRTNQGTGSTRRALVRFDLTEALPRNAIVESVTLHLTAQSGNPGVAEVRLYRVLADWGEGASVSGGGSGAPSQPGDATWIHTFYDDRFWEYAGGHFVGTASGAFEVDGPGEYAIDGEAKMLADVRMWAANPSHNFGWILIGDETRRQSAKLFASRESEAPPALEITYRIAGDPRRP